MAIAELLKEQKSSKDIDSIMVRFNLEDERESYVSRRIREIAAQTGLSYGKVVYHLIDEGVALLDIQIEQES
jgi:hypothetical protein